MTLEKKPRRWSRRTKVWDRPNWINLKWISRRKTLLNLGVNNFSDSNQEAFGRPYWHFIGPYPKEWMDSSQFLFLLFFHQDSPTPRRWLSLAPPLFPCRRLSIGGKKYGTFMSEVPKFSQDGGFCWGNAARSSWQNIQLHFTLGNVTQRSSEDFEVGEIIFIHQDRWVRRETCWTWSHVLQDVCLVLHFFFYL